MAEKVDIITIKTDVLLRCILSLLLYSRLSALLTEFAIPLKYSSSRLTVFIAYEGGEKKSEFNSSKMKSIETSHL